MANVRAVRYRRLALAEGDKAKADLLLKLADESDRGISAPPNGFRPGYPSKRSGCKTPRCGSDGILSIDHRRVRDCGPPENGSPEPPADCQRPVIGGEALNATFGPANGPPTNSATSNAAASKLPPITAKKPMLDFCCAISRSRTTTTQGVHRIATGGMASRSYLLSHPGDIRSGRARIGFLLYP